MNRVKGTSNLTGPIARKLTTLDVAFGIGRKATDEELEEYLIRPYGKRIPLKQAIVQIKENLQKKNDNKPTP